MHLLKDLVWNNCLSALFPASLTLFTWRCIWLIISMFLYYYFMLPGLLMQWTYISIVNKLQKAPNVYMGKILVRYFFAFYFSRFLPIGASFKTTLLFIWRLKVPFMRCKDCFYALHCCAFEYASILPMGDYSFNFKLYIPKLLQLFSRIFFNLLENWRSCFLSISIQIEEG